ncbi:NADP-dependent oxidoreductase [Streptomyces humi]|uniref:NADP-dependent oxidoreductase n=1 Tax=Streptomyces humi TaxID=1428620 RepID=UPI0006287CAF|nr:NADP-dependent oxidoreductase [Streptomyces humi]
MSLAVQFSEYGATEHLRVVDVTPPAPGPGQVRLAVRAAGVNPIDWKILQGAMREQIPLTLPAGLGSDVAGVVDAVGQGVTGIEIGDEVLGTSLTPSYAQSALADPAALVARPGTVPWHVAGALAGAGGTAWTVLERLKVTEGDTVLMHAAAGGVGTFAVQLAAARGARVIGTASERNHGLLRELGALPVTYGPGLVERVRAVAPDGVDAVVDASGRGEIPDSIELAGGPERVLTLVAFDAAGTGIQIHTGGAAGQGARALGEILQLIQDGRLRVPVARTYGLTEAAAALEASRTGHATGKIVLLTGAATGHDGSSEAP